MIGVITGSEKVGINPDNVATPIAASLGDLITLSLLAGISSTLYDHRGEDIYSDWNENHDKPKLFSWYKWLVWIFFKIISTFRTVDGSIISLVWDTLLHIGYEGCTIDFLKKSWSRFTHYTIYSFLNTMIFKDLIFWATPQTKVSVFLPSDFFLSITKHSTAAAFYRN